MEAAFAVIGGVLGFAYWRGTVPRLRSEWMVYVAFGAVIAWVIAGIFFGPTPPFCVTANRC